MLSYRDLITTVNNNPLGSTFYLNTFLQIICKIAFPKLGNFSKKTWLNKISKRPKNSIKGIAR